MLYELNNNNKKEIKKVTKKNFQHIGWTEKDFELLLSQNIENLISTNDLMTIFTERPYKEEPDILALDKKGDLYIFELKRWFSNTENLLQVLRYGQLYGNSNYDDLNELFYRTHKCKNKELIEEHKKYFNLDDDIALKSNDFNKNQHFLIVTNGMDLKTIEAIIYWKKCGLNIDGIIYWVFEIENKYFIEFNMYSPLQNQLEYESCNYILNTNYSNSEKSHNEMLNQKKAAAYCGGWKEKIAKLQENDVVFLYQTGVGIVAYGKADGKLCKKEWDGIEDDEYYMELKDFYILPKPISASEMKRLAKKGFAFRTTMYSIDDETTKIFIDYIKNM